MSMSEDITFVFLVGNDVGPSSSSKTTNKFEGLSQQASTSSAKTALGPRVLPKLPQKGKIPPLYTHML